MPPRLGVEAGSPDESYAHSRLTAINESIIADCVNDLCNSAQWINIETHLSRVTSRRLSPPIDHERSPVRLLDRSASSQSHRSVVILHSTTQNNSRLRKAYFHPYQRRLPVQHVLPIPPRAFASTPVWEVIYAIIIANVRVDPSGFRMELNFHSRQFRSLFSDRQSR